MDFLLPGKDLAVRFRMNAHSRSPARAIFEALSSIRLAVVVMVTLGLTSLLATIYESKHGTAAVQRDVYRTVWFAAILVTLGVNIFCVLMSRYPWKKHHIGFVLAHVGILLLLTGSLYSLWAGFDGNMAVFEGETTDRVSLLEKVVEIQLPDGTRSRVGFDFEKNPPHPDRPRRIPIKGTDFTLVAEDFHRHVNIHEGFAEAKEGPPALRFMLQGPFGKQESWLVAGDADRHGIDFGPAAFDFHAESMPSDHEHTTEGKNHLGFLLRKDGALAYTLTSTKEPPRKGTLEVGKPLETPWMGMTVTVDHFLPHSTTKLEVTPGTPPVKDERKQPAVKVHVESAAGRSPSDWLAWSSSAVHLPFGDGEVILGYRPPELATPFQVTLLDFNSEKYPGSNMAATYESFIRVDDPERGVSEHHISMNHPLHYRGYIFFQASFVEGQPMMSIFSVARSPGLPLVYLGTTLISIGVVWMFYVKPYLARRQAAQALKAHREREALHARQAPTAPADPDPARGPAEPAGSGA
jgi:hypothetical protein